MGVGEQGGKLRAITQDPPTHLRLEPMSPTHKHTTTQPAGRRLTVLPSFWLTGGPSHPVDALRCPRMYSTYFSVCSIIVGVGPAGGGSEWECLWW